jgi:hypothetical protein
MAKDDGTPGDETLTAAFEELKRDGAAWMSAERKLFQARFWSGIRRVELAAILAIGALMATVAATITLANMLVYMLAPSFGLVWASLLVAIALLIAGALLIVWLKSLLHPSELSGRAVSSAKVLWSVFNEPN